MWTGNWRLREKKKQDFLNHPHMCGQNPVHFIAAVAVTSTWSVAHLNRCVSTCCSNMALKATLRWCHRRSKVNMLQPNVLHPNVHSWNDRKFILYLPTFTLMKNYPSWVLVLLSYSHQEVWGARRQHVDLCPPLAPAHRLHSPHLTPGGRGRETGPSLPQ